MELILGFVVDFIIGIISFFLNILMFIFGVKGTVIICAVATLFFCMKGIRALT